MASFFLEKGLVINRLGVELEYVARTETELYFEELETGRRETVLLDDFWSEYQTQRIVIIKAFSSPKALITSPDANAPKFIDIADIPEHNQEEVHRRFTYVSKIIESGVTFGQKKLLPLVAARIANEINDLKGVPSTTTLNRWGREYRNSNNDVQALISKNVARSKIQRLDDRSEQFLLNKIDEHYLIDLRPSVATAYEKYRDDLILTNRGIEQGRGGQKLTLVCYKTFFNRVNALPKIDVMTAREGRDAARHEYKMSKGHLPGSHPLDFVEIDHTPLNLYVIDDIAYLPLGRPWMTAIKDRFTGMLLGFYVGFQPTGLNCIYGALKHSLHAHHMVNERWPEIENRWPAHGLGVKYVSDRGADFKSGQLRNAIYSLGAGFELCPVRTPWHKASIERFFLTIEQTLFECLPGRTFSCIKERKEYKPEKQAVLRFSTFVFLLHKWAVDFHNVGENSRKKASPIELWNEGILYAPPRYPTSIDELNRILGDRRTGTLSQEGIRFKWLNYANDDLEYLMRNIGKGVKVEYVSSQEDMGYINVKIPRSYDYLKVPCTRLDYANGLSLFQHQYLVNEARLHSTKGAVDILMNTRAVVSDTVADAVIQKENQAKVRLAKLACINSNDVLQGRERSVTTPFPRLNSDVKPIANNYEAPVSALPRFAWGV